MPSTVCDSLWIRGTRRGNQPAPRAELPTVYCLTLLGCLPVLPYYPPWSASPALSNPPLMSIPPVSELR